ncbi:MAG: hypothetical protein AAB848_01530, partial [Patescibacteria group bacterium]
MYSCGKSAKIMHKNCGNCRTDFEVPEEDISFYEKISPVFKGKTYNIPTPKLCPPCRRQRRMSFRNERSLYVRKCDLTGKSIISAYSEDKPFKVYQHTEWETDAWDPMDYGKDYDFNKLFFDQFNDLQLNVPKKALHIPDSMINCDYCNYGGNAKDCYLCFAPFGSQNCLYARIPFGCNCDIDGEANILCQYIYECTSCINCYECFYCQYCDNCKCSAFLIDCISCENCFGCVGQKHKQYMFLNQQLSHEEYEQKTRGILGSPEKLSEFEKQFEEIKKKSIYKFVRNTNVENSTGELLRHCKNCFDSYDLMNQEDSRYCELGGEQSHHNYDTTITGLNAVNCYEHIGSLGCHDSAFMVYINNDQNCYYCISCRNCKNCFGCEGLKRKEYCILNKQYSKGEYEELVPKIIKHMLENKQWGELFPTNISPYAYNESLANIYFPLSKEEVLSKGWQWKNIEEKISKESPLEEVLNCSACGRNYKIIKQERDFYKKYGLCSPSKCPNCRYKQRIDSMN